MTSRLLRYSVRCSIGETADAGYTDDLATAIWHAEHSPYPGQDAYDRVEQRYVGGGPPPEYELRDAIQRFVASLTVPGWHEYPYFPIDELMRVRAQAAATKHMVDYPHWKPTPEYIVGPLRMALYLAMGLERRAAESEPPGQLAIYPDGRDLTGPWQMGPDTFEVWACQHGFTPKSFIRVSMTAGEALRPETHWQFRDRVYRKIPDAFFPTYGLYFKSAEEADEWLSFDPGDHNTLQAEQKVHDEPDRFGEWQRWQSGEYPSALS